MSDQAAPTVAIHPATRPEDLALVRALFLEYADWLDFDPYLNFPQGARPIWTPVFDWLSTLFVLPFHAVAGLAGAGDFIVCLGAGSISQWAYALPGELAKSGKT